MNAGAVSSNLFSFGSKNQISVLIISYNTREMTLACIASVFEQTTPGTFEVIVVDNASTDGSADAIDAAFPDVRLVRLEQNVGFAAGNNVAAEVATGRFLLLLNPDTVVLDRAIDRLVAFAEANDRAGIWGGRTVFADGSLNPASCWARPTLWSVFCIASGMTACFRGSALFNPESFGSWRRDTVREVDIVSGCFFLIRRELWDKLGGFDPAFFMYGEEADLCLRAAKLGHRGMVTPDATIIHHGGASERAKSGKMIKLFDAKARLFRRHWPSWQVPIGIALLDGWALSRWVAFSCLSVVKSSARPSAETWREIWRNRSKWRKGADIVHPFRSGTPSSFGHHLMRDA
jgi:GT2 family glycosyltransferase